MKYRVNVKPGLFWDFLKLNTYISLETPPTIPNLHPFKFPKNKIIDSSPNKRKCLS